MTGVTGVIDVTGVTGVTTGAAMSTDATLECAGVVKRFGAKRA